MQWKTGQSGRMNYRMHKATAVNRNYVITLDGHKLLLYVAIADGPLSLDQCNPLRSRSSLEEFSYARCRTAASSRSDMTQSNAARIRDLSTSKPLRAEQADIKLALEQFACEAADRTEIGSSYVYLDRLLLGSPAGAKDAHIRKISLILSSWLDETSLAELALAFAALTAIQQTDLESAVSIFGQDGLESRILEAAEIITMPQKLVEESDYASAKKHYTLFVAQAAGASKMAKLAETLANVSDSWIKHAVSRNNEDRVVRAAAMLAMTKLHALQSQSPPASAIGSTVDLDILQDIFVSGSSASDISLISILLETMSVATLAAAGRQSLAARPELLQQILRQTQDAKVHFGAASTLLNMTAYRKEVSEDERTTAQLKRYADSGGKTAGAQEEADTTVDRRNKQLLDMGIVPAMVPLCKGTSPVVRSLAGRILHNIARVTAHRAKLIQQGGARMLLAIVLQSGQLPDRNDASFDGEAVQALAKLLITANPAIIFGSGTSGLENAVVPIATLVTSDSSTRLQRFEALMALTNIASVSEALADSIARAPRLLDTIDEVFMTSSSASADQGHVLCRRAAIQLLCNMAVSEGAFLRYTAADQRDNLAKGKVPGPVAGRLQILIALTDVEDLPTRQAALAALSQFTYASTLCQWVAADDKRFTSIAKCIEDDDAGMQLRAIACLTNIAKEATERRIAAHQMLLQLCHITDSQEVRAVAQESLTAI